MGWPISLLRLSSAANNNFVPDRPNLAFIEVDYVDMHVKWIHSHVLKGNPTRILDLGCGSDLYTHRLECGFGEVVFYRSLGESVGSPEDDLIGILSNQRKTWPYQTNAAD